MQLPRTIFDVAAKHHLAQGQSERYHQIIYRRQAWRAAQMWGHNHPITQAYRQFWIRRMAGK